MNQVTLNFGDDDEDEDEEEDDSISQAIESIPSDVVAFGQGDLYDEQKHLDALTYSSSVSGALGEEGSFDYIDDPNQEPSEAPAMLKQLLPFLWHVNFFIFVFCSKLINHCKLNYKVNKMNAYEHPNTVIIIAIIIVDYCIFI